MGRNRCNSADAAATRPSQRVGTKQAIRDAAKKDSNGDFVDPNTGDIQPKGRLTAATSTVGNGGGLRKWHEEKVGAANSLLITKTNPKGPKLIIRRLIAHIRTRSPNVPK